MYSVYKPTILINFENKKRISHIQLCLNSQNLRLPIGAPFDPL